MLILGLQHSISVHDIPTKMMPVFFLSPVHILPSALLARHSVLVSLPYCQMYANGSGRGKRR